ncbi:hypothetical protein JOF53_005566 [Crossiella equi]|uniref:Uncharacterized protein n=1 Tax=Crossiella equi TaxID=130796 RepID=A0ABS5AKF4_9PSEU|nr:hypothetical protein [Crossiella equi]MBP2476694.1 hypothetical protein [Crossiella equi]
MFTRWEQERTDPGELALELDARQWREDLPEDERADLSLLLHEFTLAEYTALDVLAPLLTGSPDEHAALFLGTQLADVTRHSRSMLRIAHRVLGLPDHPRAVLASCWRTIGPKRRAVHELEGQLAGELLRQPGDRSHWLRAAAMTYLVMEGAAGITGRRAVIASLSQLDRLPGVRSVFTGFTRDASRHLAFGHHALRAGVRAGYADDICDLVETAAPVAVRSMAGHADPAAERAHVWHAVRNMQRGLRMAGLDSAFVRHIALRCTEEALPLAVSASTR